MDLPNDEIRADFERVSAARNMIGRRYEVVCIDAQEPRTRDSAVYCVVYPTNEAAWEDSAHHMGGVHVMECDGRRYTWFAGSSNRNGSG